MVYTSETLIFCNRSEGFLLKVASFMGVGASLMPILFLINGRINIFHFLIQFGLFLSIATITFLQRRNKTIEVRLSDHLIEIIFPYKNKVIQIKFDQILKVDYSDLCSSLSLYLKNGKKISLGSSIRRVGGEFSVPDLGSASDEGAPGERLRLKFEIESRMTK